MKAVFPGKPQAKLQAVSTALWEDQRIVVYISGNAVIILGGPNELLQTISLDEATGLEAVAISEESGKIATCTKDEVFVYSPFGREMGAIKWSLQHAFAPSTPSPHLSCLSWGESEEVLAGGTSLTLFHTAHPLREVWTKSLANPVKLVAFTPDASFIASTGWHDRLVKIWTRVFVDGDNERFDVSYLSHPSSVTSIRWHRRPDQEHHSDTVLYTTCGDSKLRIWAATDHHGLQALQLWADLDLDTCIMPRTLPSPSSPRKRYAFVVDGWEFEATVERAIQLGGGGEKETYTREHLMDVAYRNPDICVVMDDRGNMSAWGLERVGCKARQTNDIFNIALMEGLDLNLPDGSDDADDYVCFYNFAGVDDGKLNVLAHFFDGRVEWLASPIDQLLDPSSTSRRFRVEAIWTGHSEPLNSLHSSSNGDTLLSVASPHEVIAWTQGDDKVQTTIRRSSRFSIPDEVVLSYMFPDGRYAAFLHGNEVSLWDLGTSTAAKLASCIYEPTGQPLFLTCPANASYSNDEKFLILVTSAKQAMIWRTSCKEQGTFDTMHPFKEVSIKDDGENLTVIPVKSKPKANAPGIVACSVTGNGRLSLWASVLNLEDDTAEMALQQTISTEIRNPSLVSIGEYSRGAIVDATGAKLTIWDLCHGHLELKLEFPAHDTIEALDWTSTGEQNSILAVAFAHRAHVYIRNRYHFAKDSSPWSLIRTMEISQLTNLPIVACTWLFNNDLILAAGNQMFLYGNHVDVPQAVIDGVEIPSKWNPVAPLHKVVSALNCAPALFHPQVLLQMIRAGKITSVDLILHKLHSILKFWTQGDELDSCLDLKSSQLCDASDSKATNTSRAWTGSVNGVAEEDERVSFSEEAATSLKEILATLNLPYISDEQQAHLGQLAEHVALYERLRATIDDLALRYLVHLRQHIAHSPTAKSSRSQLPWRDINWAFHSEHQEILIDQTSQVYSGRMLWEDARECGMFMWITDIEALRTQFEVVGRNEYAKTEDRNPVDCSLYYLALKKKTVLVGLWRMAIGNREQGPTRKLLMNDFTDPRWQTAAMKNAYALLGFRRFEYAAAFFLLADRLKDAVNVLANQLKDIQLAVAVARVYEGDGGPVLKQLLENNVLPQAAQEGNKWLATWTFWMLNRKDLALQVLIMPIDELVGMSDSESIHSKHFYNDEPALVHLYKILRDKSSHSRREKLNIPPKAEWDLVMRSARSYVHSGCHYLALDLLRNWEFTKQTKRRKRRSRANGMSRSSIDSKIKIDIANAVQVGEESLATNAPAEVASPMVASPVEMSNAGLSGRKKVTEEPSAASILDNFKF